MLITNCRLEIANNLMERQPLTASMLPCCAYHGEVHDYIAAQIPPHWHHEVELFLLETGAVEVSLADMRFQLKRGEGYFVNGDKLHSVRSLNDGPCRYRSLVFDISVIAGATGSPYDLQFTRPLLEHGPPALMLRPDVPWQAPVYAAFEACFASCAQEGFGYEFAVRSHLSDVVLALCTHCVEQASPSPSLREQRLKRLVAWIDENYERPVRLTELAEAINFSPRECERIFKELLHMSPMAYVTRRRIAAASELLVNSDLSITEIGLRCGFSSHSYFTKQFHALTGYTPREFRANIKQ